MANQRRPRRQYLGRSDPAQQYIASYASRDGARKALKFGFDSHKFADGAFGDEREILEAVRVEFGDELPGGWLHRRLGELTE